MSHSSSLGASLTTKLMPPTQRSLLVDRPQLIARIERGQEQKLLLVCAPAGYGKTSVLVRAHAQLKAAGRSVGWISLDESDKDLSRFISYLVDAVRRTGIRFGQGLAILLSGGASLPSDTLKTLLLNELSTLDQDLFLILDDYHLIADEDIRDLVNAILLSPIPHIHFLIATRTHNELPVSRLRALGQLHEVAVTDLMFSELEVGEFVAKVSGVQLSEAQVTRLREGTEGWVASLQMVGIALSDSGDIDHFLDRFSGEHRSIGDFLGEEVLRRQPEELQDFLLATSILNRFNCSLSNAVLERENGRAMIDEIERRNLFVFSLDAEHHWYRYHHLFSDFLRRRLKDRHPDRAAEYHRHASRWLAEHRFMTEAIGHAFNAGDIAGAGELLDRASGDLFAAGQTATLLSLSSRLPGELLHRLPRLQLECAWHSELSWKFTDAKLALEHVRTALDERLEHGEAGSCAEMVFLEAKLAHRQMMLALLSDDSATTLRLAQAWLKDGKTRDPFMCASAGSAIMAANRELFHCEGVTTSSRMLHERFIEGGASYGVVFHQSIAGATFMARGDLAHAQEAYERALQVAVELHGEHSTLYNMPALMFAELYYERDQLHQAEEILAQRDIASELGFVDNLIAGFVTSGRLLMLRGRRIEAETLLEDGAWLATQYGFERMQAAILNERVRALLLGNGVKEAQALVRASEFKDGPDAALVPREGSTTREELLALVAARLLLAAGNPREAAAQLRLWYAFTKGRHCHRSALRCGVLLAKALSAAGDRRAALRVMVECLQMGESGCFIRSLIDEGADIVDLLMEIERTSLPEGGPFSQDYLRRVLAAAGVLDRRPAERASPDQGSADQASLSQREIQILDLGARGYQNLDIAESLCLAESTVKWYWQRIFDKLDVRRRPDAIKRARQHHWIS